MRITRLTRAGVAVAVLAVVAAGCGTTSGDDESRRRPDQAAEEQGGFTAPDLPMAEELGEDEGSLSVLAWPGYAEDGSTDKSVDWVTPFEEETGCDVNVKYFGTSDEAVTLMKSGEYDVVSASGDASLRLIAGGDVEPVNTDLIDNYADVWASSRTASGTPSTAQMYGVPHGYGANLLMYNTEEVTPAPTDWSVVFDGGSDYNGKVTAYDSPIYIADAALYLMNTQPDLGIEHPYALDEDQLAAAVDLLKAQRENVGEYWSDYLKEIQAFTHRRLGRRHHLAGHRQPRPGRQGPGRGDPARDRLHRLVGHLDDQLQDRDTGTAPTRGSTTSSAPRPTPRSPSGSARRRPTARPAT